ncbi:hypothetical protein B0T25DRAFT_492144 [Lasiosphaeria hispida]|uniref:Uncharacterized protein n=1 Tax=Lasiosphaeria hispida TaxID=260671 RepID=A0AAJ0MKC1_9PEZI|nr:hypothetical protein B0T25DRAFT_492144 [Lasiosphaeria hispida]
MDTQAPPAPSSQAAPRFVLNPLPASTLLDQEFDRRSELKRRGNILTGCAEIDDYVLLGGFERGCVVGVSAEEDDMGMLIGLQTIAHLLTRKSNDGTEPRAMIITILPTSVLLPKLREVLVGQVAVLQRALHDVQARVKGCLENISIARVFDVEGLWEVLRELDKAGSVENTTSEATQAALERQKSDQETPHDVPNDPREKDATEMSDSRLKSDTPLQDHSPDKPPNKPVEKTRPKKPENRRSTSQTPSPLPDLILITHTSVLLKTLFTGRDKATAHDTILHLSTHLHHLTRSPSHGGPLIMLLNSTTSSPAPEAINESNRPPPTHDPASRPRKHPEPTLRSIFSPPLGATTPTGMLVSDRGYHKPSFGLVFAQLLDLHLLCTRVPRRRADVAGLVLPGLVAGNVKGARFAWVVQVLLDEIGVYRVDEGEWGRREREQRWAAVDVEGERVVDMGRTGR